MECIAKILERKRIENEQGWKYTFLDTQTNQESYFYHNEQISYNPDISGKLELTEDKFFVSFEKEIDNSSENLQDKQTLIQLEESIAWEVEKLTNELPKKRIKLSFGVQHLHDLHNRGYTWKQVASIYGKHEQTVYYWLKSNNKVLQKRGVKPIINKEVISLVCSYVLKNTTKTQQEITDYVYLRIRH